MAGFFNLPSARSTTKRDMKLAQKSKKASTMSTITIKGTGTLIDKIQSIVSLVNSKFANKKDQFILIRDEESFISYIDKCVANGVISIDTETTGLDPIENHIVGLCIYTPGMKAAYVPVNHISYITQNKVENQLSVEFLREQMERINTENVKTIWFNAPFDIRFIKHTLGVLLTPYWDASIAARILNSNEPRGARGLKPLHKKYCNQGKGEAFSFDKLFEGIPFDLIPINTAYLYAANDAVITYELYKFQEYYLDPNYEGYKTHHMEGPSNVFFNIEMKSMPVFIEMEENGVTIDIEYAKTISEKYHKLAEDVEKRAEAVLLQYKDEIDDYIRHTPTTKLTNPINIASPIQLAELLYDVFKIKSKDSKKPRGTGDEILERIDHPLVDVIRDQRFFDKQISTYVDKIPALVHADGRVHCKFNQYGADCVVGNSLLLTDKGYCTIDSLFTGSEENGKFYDCNETIYNINLQQEQASHKIVFYTTPTIKLTLHGGHTIEGTPNHPIICSQLTKDDIQRNKSKRQLQRLTETHNFRKLEDIKEGDIVVIPYGYNIFPTKYTTIKSNTSESFITLDEELAEKLGSSLEQRKDYPTLNIGLMQSPKSVICSFIKGYVLSNYIINKDSIQLCNISKNFLVFIKQVLTNIGIITTGNDNCINITGEMYKKFLYEIGLSDTNNYVISEDNYYYAYVEKIEHTHDTVYDLTVPGTHSFICNGLINHNTGRVSSDSPKQSVDWAIKIRLIQGRATA